jgi:hypothetical protein
MFISREHSGAHSRGHFRRRGAVVNFIGVPLFQKTEKP